MIYKIQKLVQRGINSTQDQLYKVAKIPLFNLKIGIFKPSKVLQLRSPQIPHSKARGTKFQEFFLVLPTLQLSSMQGIFKPSKVLQVRSPPQMAHIKAKANS
ncbi:hypothetical protein CsSME_00010614 [Camellia sinensis var. sinensis]